MCMRSTSCPTGREADIPEFGHWWQLAAIRHHAGREGVGVEERRDADSELTIDLECRRFGVLVAHAPQVVGRQGRIHLGCGRLPNRRGRVVAAVVTTVQLPERSALLVGLKLDLGIEWCVSGPASSREPAGSRRRRAPPEARLESHAAARVVARRSDPPAPRACREDLAAALVLIGVLTARHDRPAAAARRQHEGDGQGENASARILLTSASATLYTIVEQARNASCNL